MPANLPYTMTKTMDSFSDAQNNAMTANSMTGFDDELMTPLIDFSPYDSKEKEMACQWINSSHDNLKINLEQDFVAFGDSPIISSTVLNSPPDSVKSHISNEDSNGFNYETSNIMEAEQSYNFIDPLVQPMKNSQDALCFPGANGFHDEIEKLSNEPNFNFNANYDYVKNEHDLMNEDLTPISGNDFMLTGNSGFKFNQQIIKKENNIKTHEVTKVRDENMNILPMHTVKPKLLARRTELKLTVKMAPIDEKLPDKQNTTVVSTPQLFENILGMEDDFDLVNYIDSDNNKPQPTKMIESNSPKQTVEDTVTIPSTIEQILPTPVASPKNKPEQDDNDDEIVQEPSTFTPEKRKRRAVTKIDFSDDYQPKRPRGRPPKVGPTTISMAEYKRLSPSDRKYYEMRIKNNEASRRSRLNRKGKEEALFDELHRLENENINLHQMDIKIDIELEKWKKKLIKLYAL